MNVVGSIAPKFPLLTSATKRPMLLAMPPRHTIESTNAAQE